MAVFTVSLREQADEIIARYPSPRSALMPLLYLAQYAEGWVTQEAMTEIGEMLEISTAEVTAVASFYTMFRLQPAGDYLIDICTNLSCALRGGKELLATAKDDLGPGCEGVTPDGKITLHEEECLGVCEFAPVVQVNFANYYRMDAERLTALIAKLRVMQPPPADAGVTPKNLRQASRILAGLPVDDAEEASA